MLLQGKDIDNEIVSAKDDPSPTLISCFSQEFFWNYQKKLLTFTVY